MNELLYEFELDKKYIEEYPLETTEGTKKMIKTYHINAINSRNAYINNKIEKYTSLKQKVFELLKQRVETLTPKDTSNNYINIKKNISNYKNIIRYNNEYNDVYEKLGFDKIISDIGDTDISDLLKVNTLISQILNIYAQAGLTITINDFDYSVHTKDYMDTYLTNQSSHSFNDIMKNKFNELYWECPNIIMHLKLSLRNLYHKYNKQLETYFQSLKDETFISNNTDINNYNNSYINLNNQLETYQNKDIYILSYKFLNDDLSIYDYEEDTPQFRKHFNRFLFNDEFKNLNEQDQINFYKEVKNLKYVVTELKQYNLYKDFVKDIVERYKQKDTYKNIYSVKLKEIEKEEKIRQDLYNQYYQKNKKFLFFNKKVNKELLKVQINDQIKKLDMLYLELDDTKINDIILSKFDDTTTIYDALSLLTAYYSYFKNLYLKFHKGETNIDYNNEYQVLFDYVYDVNNTFIKKIKFIDDTDINDIIYEKYKLLNINLSKEDLTDNIHLLENSIDYINLINNINNSDISIKTIKFINDFKKIDKN